ncbi:uncharacterized protein [Struthio camelus]|uniref:uncharacterized protein isoform X1 n=1 Tax=Struthio camelus TaxID=8801 RepID=UPI0036041C94
MYDRRRKAFWSLICHNRISIEADRHSSPASGLLSVELFLSCLSKLYPSRRFPKPHAVQQMSGLSHLLAASGTCNWSVPSWVPARWKENPALSEGDRERISFSGSTLHMASPWLILSSDACGLSRQTPRPPGLCGQSCVGLFCRGGKGSSKGVPKHTKDLDS